MKKSNALLFMAFFAVIVLFVSSCAPDQTGQVISDAETESEVSDAENVELEEEIPTVDGVAFYTRGIAPPDVRENTDPYDVVMVFKVSNYESGNYMQYLFRNDMVLDDVTRSVVYNGQSGVIYNYDSRNGFWTVEFEKWIIESVMDIFGPMVDTLLDQINEHGTDDFSFTGVIAGHETEVFVYDIDMQAEIPVNQFMMQ